MKRTVRFLLIFALVLLGSSACKTKQKLTEIQGANLPAKANTVVAQPSVTSNPVANQQVAAEPEVTRNENFSLAEGETNTDALNYKYHVVVGSFSKQANAKGLQNTLNAEGKKAVVVVNEKGMYRVLIASFNDYAQAHALITQIDTRFPGSWVLVQK